MSRERISIFSSCESQSKPGTKMVYPEPCTGLRRRPQLFLVGIVPYSPSSTQVLIVALLDQGHNGPKGVPEHRRQVLRASDRRELG